MTVLYAPVAAVAAAALTANIVGTGSGLLIDVGAPALAATVAFAVWVYSPLPNHNHGFMSPSDDGRYWGFSRE